MDTEPSFEIPDYIFTSQTLSMGKTVRLTDFHVMFVTATMSQVSSWATSAREGLMRCPANIDNTNEDLQAIDVIENFLTGGRSVLRAAHRIATIYEPRLRTGHRNDITVLWRNICQAARSVDSSASVRLAQLVLSLCDQPDVISPAGHVVKNGHLVYWRDLPGWGQMFREYGYGKLNVLGYYLPRKIPFVC